MDWHRKVNPVTRLLFGRGRVGFRASGLAAAEESAQTAQEITHGFSRGAIRGGGCVGGGLTT